MLLPRGILGAHSDRMGMNQAAGTAPPAAPLLIVQVCTYKSWDGEAEAWVQPVINANFLCRNVLAKDTVALQISRFLLLPIFLLLFFYYKPKLKETTKLTDPQLLRHLLPPSFSS